MKKEKRKSTSWLMGGLAALTFLSSGSMAAAQVVTSYNDLAWGSGQIYTNITKITSPNGVSGLPSIGQLVDFSTGTPTAVTLEVAGGEFDGTSHATTGAAPTMGDAFAIFDGKVNGQGALSYINLVGSDLVLTFTNMDPDKFYDLTFFADRGLYGWDRASLVTISGEVAFSNTSSIATDNPDTVTYPGGVLFTGPTSPSTRLPADNDNGYVARFSNIKSGIDGEVVLTISFDGNVPSQYRAKYASAIRLVEVGNIPPTDINGDGKADIVWRNTNNGDVAVWLGDGVNAPTIGGLLAGAVPATWVIKDIGDVDGDGLADLVWRDTSTGDVGVWLGNGVNPPTMTSVIAAAVPATWVIAGVGDLDGDGKADLVWRETTTGNVGVWLGNGLTLGMTGVLGGAPTNWVIKGVGDVDGDGLADLLWRETNTGDVGVWLGNGVNPPTMTSVIAAAVPATWVIAGVGDLDGDGKADLVWRETTTGNVGVWLGNGLTLGMTGVLGSAPTNWVIKGVGDVDGDGLADLLWRETNTGDVGVWLGNGVNPPTMTSVIGAAVPLAQKIQP